MQEYPNLFPGIEEALRAEQYLRTQAAHPRPASLYPQLEGEHLQARVRDPPGLAALTLWQS